MSEELKPAAVHDANVFLPGSLGPVRREVVLACEHDRVVDQLRAELSALKAGQGEAVEIVAHLVLGGMFDGREYGDIDYQIEPDIAERLQQKNVKTAEDVQLELMTVAQHERIVAAITPPPPDPGTVPVRRDLLGRVLDPETGEEWSNACRELRALLAQSEGMKS